jgi:hypothetical protein
MNLATPWVAAIALGGAPIAVPVIDDFGGKGGFPCLPPNVL